MRFVELEGSTRSMSLRGDLRAARNLWRILRAERPDVLHTHNPKPGLYGRIVGRLAGVPRVVHTTHGLYAAPDDPLPKRLARLLPSRPWPAASATWSWCRTPRTSS